MSLKALADAARYLGLELGSATLQSFQRYRGELLTWNARANLTALKTPDEVESVLFVESLGLTAAFPRPLPLDSRLLDVGSGAGIPGLPLKLALPNLPVTLLEATGKKLRFLEHVVEVLGLEGVEVAGGRAEDLARQSDYREMYPIVVARALAPMAILAELCLPFTSIGGSVVTLKGRDAALDLERGKEAIHRLGGEVRDLLPVELPGSLRRLRLVVLRKVKPTPPAYPRRSGIPRKRPLR